jgi:hypothetical protein
LHSDDADFRITIDAPEYWVARSSRAMTLSVTNGVFCVAATGCDRPLFPSNAILIRTIRLIRKIIWLAFGFSHSVRPN